MASVSEMLPGLVNLVKSLIAMRLAKDGLEPFVQDDLTQYIKDLLQFIYSNHNVKEGTICQSCTTLNILPCKTRNFCKLEQGRCKIHNGEALDKKSQVDCPQGICHHIREDLYSSHRYSSPTWTNTDATKWCTSFIEIAKCYIASGYKDKSDLDLNAILSVIVNKKSFGPKMSTKVSSKSEEENICKKVLQMGNKIRHSGSLNISDTELKDYINGLVDILSDSKCLAQDANAVKSVSQLKQLLNATLVIGTEQTDEALDETMEVLISNDKNNSQISCGNEDFANVSDTSEQVVAGAQPSVNISEVLSPIFKEIRNELSGRKNVRISDITDIIAAKVNALEEIKKAAEDYALEFKRQKEELQLEIRSERESSSVQFFQRRRYLKELRQDLSKFYRSRYHTISISPLVPAHDVPLIDLYVQPTLEYADVTNSLEGAPADLKIRSYEDLFFHQESSFKEIYITAKAGIGKTSFAKRICMTWCQAHFQLKQLKNSFDENDIKTLKKFDFLFMIPLKETQSEECNIDGMILHLVEKQLKSKCPHLKSYLEHILRNKTVLVILDGLDEWVHPENCQNKGDVIPHRRPCSNCSVITTTRPWKLASAKLRNSQINMHAELLEFDETSSEKLVHSAVNLLNKTHKRSKSAGDFQEVSLRLLGGLRFIPYILLQVICLWYDDRSIGKSQCEIYSNALELTLSLESHMEGTTSAVKCNAIPKCLSQNKTCSSLYPMLLKVGQLAFEALYSYTSESTLLFDEDIVKQYLDEDLKFILKKGILSQNKDSSKVASWKTYFSFQHKSIQEYFAALYIQAFPENKNISDKIVERHKTLESVLEMSNVYIFLGGFNPDICGRLLLELKGILSSDDICYQYRNYLSGRTSSPDKRKCREIVKSFQNMQTDILQEVSRNGANDCHLYLEDLVLDDSIQMDVLTLLADIIQENKDNLKSISIEQSPSKEDLEEKIRMFQIQSSKNLQKLDITAVPSEGDLLCLLSNSERTIVSLDLCFAVFRNNKYSTVYTKLSSETISVVFRMENLQSVRLNSIILIHDDVEKLITYINKKKTMTEVGLCHIRCSQHDECVMLDLSEHINLETLRIGSIPVTVMKLNGSSLKFCYTGELKTAVHIELAQRIVGAVNLKTLRLKFLYDNQSEIYTSLALAKMNQLTSFAIEKAEFAENELIIPPEMSNLERVQLYEVEMKAPVLKRFIESVSNLQQPVLVIMHDCKIISSLLTKFEGIKEKIGRNYEKYRVLFNRGKTFSFITRK